MSTAVPRLEWRRTGAVLEASAGPMSFCIYESLVEKFELRINGAEAGSHDTFEEADKAACDLARCRLSRLHEEIERVLILIN